MFGPGAKSNITVADETAVNQCMLVMSGGEGYIDFRVGDGSEEDTVKTDDNDVTSSSSADHHQQQQREKKSDLSHLIVWQVSLANT